MLGGLQMKGKDDIKPIKTSSGDSIYLFWELQMELNTESIILMNSTGKYYYERGSAKQTEGERLSNFIIEPLFVIEDSDKKIKYILKLISNDYSKVIEIEGENLAINNSFKKFCMRSEEHTSELQSRENLVCRLLLEKKKEQTHV